MQNKLTYDFLYELFKLCFRKSEVIEICNQHLKFQFLPSEPFKKVFKAITSYYTVNQKIPTFGIISQQFENDREVTELLAKIKSAPVVDREVILQTLEEYIKQSLFVDTYENIADVYNSGEKEKAYELLKKSSEEISGFSITSGSAFYEPIFDGFESRNRKRFLNREGGDELKIKVPAGIDELDALMAGGMDATDTVLFLAQSGVGKTKLLRWCGVSAARRGFKVLHIQAEGSKLESLRGYDSTWTGVINELVDYAAYDKELYQVLKRTASDIKGRGGEIYVHAYEQFTMPSIKDVRGIILDIEKNFGTVDVVILDYLELFNPGDGKKYTVDQERERRRALGRALKNIAVEFNTRIVTATQASNVPPQLTEDPNFVMTRHNLSEFKNAAEPFSMFLTLNQTRDEKATNVMRLYVDKMRNYPSGKIIKIFQSYRNDRFYDRKNTLKEFYFPEED